MVVRRRGGACTCRFVTLLPLSLPLGVVSGTTADEPDGTPTNQPVGRWAVLAIVSVALFATTFTRTVVSPVAGGVIGDLGVDAAAFGLASTALWAAYASTQLPAGLLGDRFGERRVVVGAVALTVVAGLGLAASPTFLVFAAFVVLLGAGNGMQYPPGVTLITRRFANTGRALGIHIAAAPTAGLVAPPVATLVAARFGWRVALLVGALVSVPAVVLVWVGVGPTPATRPDERLRDRVSVDTFLALLRRPEVAFTLVVAVLADFVWQATFTFLPLLLQEYHGLSTPESGVLFGVYFALLGVAGPIAGWTSDRLGRWTATGGLMLAGVVGFSTLVVADSPLLVVVGVCGAGIAMGWSAPVQSRFLDVLSPEERNTGFGLVRTTYSLVGAVGSVVTGVVADAAGWAAALGLLAGLLGVVVALLVGRAVARAGAVRRSS
jgi:MFS family permease